MTLHAPSHSHPVNLRLIFSRFGSDVADGRTAAAAAAAAAAAVTVADGIRLRWRRPRRRRRRFS